MKKSRRGKLRRLFRKDSIFCKGSMRIPEPLTVCKVFLLWTESTGGNRYPYGVGKAADVTHSMEYPKLFTMASIGFPSLQSGHSVCL
jgi:hypothetical protein